MFSFLPLFSHLLLLFFKIYFVFSGYAVIFAKFLLFYKKQVKLLIFVMSVYLPVLL